MAEAEETWQEVHRRARGAGLAACGATALLAAGLGAAGILAPGTHAVAGVYEQAGYTFTGLVFLAAAWAAWHRGRILQAFAAAPLPERIRLLRREALAGALLAGTSVLWGLLYWRMVGWNAIRHSLAFLALAPVLFLWFMPGSRTWARKEVP